LPFSSETIVVDNASHDGSIEMVRQQFPTVTAVASTVNNGFAAGMNLGLSRASGDYLLLLNTDIAILGNALTTMATYLDQHPDVGLVGPRLLNPDGSVQSSCRRFPSIRAIIYRRTPLGIFPKAKHELRRFLMLESDHTVNQPVDWLLGACMMVRRSAVEKVGALDERFFLYFEDVDWCRRFWQAGWGVHYVADAELVHYHQRASAEHPGFHGALSYATRIHIQSGYKYFTKYFRHPLPHGLHF